MAGELQWETVELVSDSGDRYEDICDKWTDISKPIVELFNYHAFGKKLEYTNRSDE